MFTFTHRSPDVATVQLSTVGAANLERFASPILPDRRKQLLPDSQMSGRAMQLSLLRLAATQPTSVTPVERSRGSREKREKKKLSGGRKRGSERLEQLPSLSAGFSALTNGLYKDGGRMKESLPELRSSTSAPLSVSLWQEVCCSDAPEWKSSHSMNTFYPHLVAISLRVGARCTPD